MTTEKGHQPFLTPGQIVSSGMDWLTIVTAEKMASRELYMQAANLARLVEPEITLWSRWTGMGYRGWSVPGLRFGVRGTDHGIAITSGDFSLSGLSLSLIELSRPTRVDVQVTFRLESRDRYVAKRLYKQLEAANESKKRPRSIKLIQSPSGDTVYVNKRTADVYLRLYDKTHDIVDGENGLYWRYEVEYKHDAAAKALERLSATKDVGILAMGLVAAEFKKRGVQPMYKNSGEITAIASKATVTTADSKISWLSKCVAPVVSQLTLAGYGEQVIHALRLKDLIIKFKE